MDCTCGHWRDGHQRRTAPYRQSSLLAVPSTTPESPAILYDPDTGNLKQGTAPFARDIFCSGNYILADGRVLMAGGSNDSCHNPNGCGIRASELFDPISETWSDNAEVSFSRYYPSNVLLPDGTSITLSSNNATGTTLIRPIESWDPLTGAWTRLPASANVPATFDLYPRMVVLPSGKLFNAGPQPDTWMFDTSSKSWSLLANMNAPYRSGEGMLLLPGLEKVLVAGGQASGGGLPTAEIIDLSSAKPKWVYTGSMSRGRHDVPKVSQIHNRLQANLIVSNPETCAEQRVVQEG